MSTKPYMLTNDTSPAFWINGIIWEPLATGVLTNNRLTLLEQRMHSGGGPPTHYHVQDEGFYLLDGSCTFNAGGQTIKASGGTFISVPRETPHSFTIDGDPSRVLNFYVPAGFEMILMGLATPAKDRSIPALDAVPVPPRWMAEELSREYGQIKVLGLPFADAPNEHNLATMPSKTNPITPYSINVSEAPAYWYDGCLWTPLATSEQTGGSYTLLEEQCRQQAEPPPHVNEQDEMVYMLEGEATFFVGSQTFNAKAGAFIFIPAGTVHSFRIVSSMIRLLNFYAPSGFEQVIFELGQPAPARTLPPINMSSQVDQERTAAVLARVGMYQIALPDSPRDKSAT